VRSDAELVAASLDGDRAAFGLLIDRHRPRVTRLARALLSDAQEAEDVTQEALLRAYLGLAELRKRESFGSWVCGIAVNLAKMRLRGARPSAADLSGGTAVSAGMLMAPDPTPEQAAEARELLALVRTAIEFLPKREREVVLMHYLDGLTCQEIAALLGERTGAVRVRLHRARRRLRTHLHIHDEEVRAMVEVTIEDVVVRILAEDADAEHPRLAKEHVRVVLLREKEGDRLLPIWVGPPEGDALALHLGGASFPRPMTADLMARLLEAAGARIERVVVNSLRENTFYATVSVVAKGETKEVDARPSDALNLALRVGAPIFVDSEVMNRSAGLGVGLTERMTQLEREWLEAEGEPEPPSEWRSLTPELVKSFYPPPPGRK
jgi:RNA polymerase sigma factor (sigma-70 family)